VLPLKLLGVPSFVLVEDDLSTIFSYSFFQTLMEGLVFKSRNMKKYTKCETAYFYLTSLSMS
jgi:hypothetical protein